ncbi:FAD/NAD(P)-binding domain-containing protein [Rhizopogon vinicolor AM-OR11-026]|uniref:FAD/NAD(P)-binding domain-containing protein n=1 Tax=Rhizopogon vinicolor AM-OR11-026 TaxID=1314800 RepID=A0A1B7MQP7_9AGAM|nr:FAD/NAD(P)-binding domain-containing protein [Rhizopogon vinicolor AM-OR11-026]
MSFSSGTPKFRVAICGAGIGGLVLAVTIGKFADRDVQIDLYEAHDDITTAGAGLVISRRTMEMIESLGLNKELFDVSTNVHHSCGPKFRKSDIPEGGFEWFYRIVTQGNPMHRQHLVDILTQNLPSSCTVHFNKRLTKYDKLSARSLVLHFADESFENTDVLIGADGIHSSVRKTFFETMDRDLVDPSMIRHYADPSWTGTLVYRATFPAGKLLEMDSNNVALGDFTIFCGKGKNIVAYPIAQGTLINVAAFVSDERKAGTPFEGRSVSDVSQEEVEEAFKDFEPAAKNLLKCCNNPSRWALHVVNELPLAACDTVALIGDACHAMRPSMGAGAGQAIEDAFVLGRLLAHPLTTLDNVPAALRAYQDARLSAAQLVARSTTHTGWMYQFNMPGYYDGTDQGNERGEMEILQKMINNQFDSYGQGSAVAELRQAERSLQESVGLCKDY